MIIFGLFGRNAVKNRTFKKFTFSTFFHFWAKNDPRQGPFLAMGSNLGSFYLSKKISKIEKFGKFSNFFRFLWLLKGDILALFLKKCQKLPFLSKVFGQNFQKWSKNAHFWHFLKNGHFWLFGNFGQKLSTGMVVFGYFFKNRFFSLLKKVPKIN